MRQMCGDFFEICAGIVRFSFAFSQGVGAWVTVPKGPGSRGNRVTWPRHERKCAENGKLCDPAPIAPNMCLCPLVILALVLESELLFSEMAANCSYLYFLDT